MKVGDLVSHVPKQDPAMKLIYGAECLSSDFNFGIIVRSRRAITGMHYEVVAPGISIESAWYSRKELKSMMSSCDKT